MSKFGLGKTDCWCGCSDYTEISGDWRNVRGTSFIIRECDECKTSRTVSCKFRPYTEGIYSSGLSRRQKNSIGTIREYCSGRVLDIGCSCGEILQALRDVHNKDERFTTFTGIDYNREAISTGRESFDLDLICGDLDDLSGRKYDSIVLIHTFEHVEKPFEFLHNLKSLFDADGEKLLYICVPNIGCLGSHEDYFGWGALDPREHYWHYNQASLVSVIKTAYEDCEILYQGTSSIWKRDEGQLEIVVKLKEV